MNIRNSVLKYLILSLLLIPILFSCTDQKIMSGSGVLKGKISIGPLCPVETIPPLPACLPTAQTYKTWATAVWSLNKKSKIATLDPTLDGTYQIDLPAGDYIVDFDVIQNNRIGGSNLPVGISITNRDTTKLNISIDTGIR